MAGRTQPFFAVRHAHNDRSVVWGEDGTSEATHFGHHSNITSNGHTPINTKLLSKEFLLTGTWDLEWAFQAPAYKYYEEDKKEAFFADVLSYAQVLIDQTRLRQMRLLRKFVRLQSLRRTQITVRKYVSYRRAAIRIQRWAKSMILGFTLKDFTTLRVEENNDRDLMSSCQDFELVLCVPSEDLI